MDSLQPAVAAASTAELPARVARPAPAAASLQDATAQATAARAVEAPEATKLAGTPAAGATTLGRGVPLVDALVTLSGGSSMVTDMVFGTDNQISQVRVLDATTHQLIASCPPETIARAQQEMIAYQAVAQTRKPI